MSILNIPKLNTLLARLTSGRAAALDAVTETRMARLDQTVSSRQSESDAASRYSALLAAFGTQTGRVKSIQYVSGSVAFGSTAAGGTVVVSISSVSTTKTVVICNGGYGSQIEDSPTSCGAKLESATTVRLMANRALEANSGWSVTVHATVVEYY